MSTFTRPRIVLAGIAIVIAGGVALGLAKAEPRGGHGIYAAGWQDGGWHGKKAHRGRGGRRGRAMEMFRYLDEDRDGSLKKTEATAVVDGKLASFDGNADGALTLDEFQGLWLDFTRRRMVDGFQRLDEDGDGRVTRAEMMWPVEMAFRFADRNEDGAIDRKDRRRGGHRWNRREEAPAPQPQPQE